jgi:hypothetical protein
VLKCLLLLLLIMHVPPLGTPPFIVNSNVKCLNFSIITKSGQSPNHANNSILTLKHGLHIYRFKAMTSYSTWTPMTPIIQTIPYPPRILSLMLLAHQLVGTCNLIDPLARQHPSRPFPASNFRGSNRINYIFVSTGIWPAVIRSGSLPHYSIMHGDQLTYHVNFDPKVLFADPVHDIQLPPI